MARKSGLLFVKRWRALTVAAGVVLIGLLLHFSGFLQGPEQTTWDLRVRTLAAPTDATDDIVLVLVDQESLELMASQNAIGWPWPRSLYGYLVEFCRYAGAASLTIDIILEDEGVASFMDDSVLRDAAEALGRVIYGTELLGAPGGPERPWPDYIARPPIAVDGLSVADARDLTFSRASFPYEYVIPDNSLLAFVNQLNDDDGVFRRYRLLSYHLDQPVPALAAGGLVFSHDGPLHFSFTGRALEVAGLRIPVDRDGKVLLRYTTPARIDPETGDRLPPRHRFYPAFDVVVSGFLLAIGEEPGIDPAEFSGKHVLVGYSASGLMDLRPTPLDPRAPGVTVHATMLDNLLSGSFMRDLPDWASVALIVALVLAAAFAATYAQSAGVEGIIMLGFLALPVGLAFGGYALGLWVPLVVPVVTAFLAVATANVANYATEGAQKRFIRGAFGQYLSPKVIAQLEADPSKLKTGGEKRDLTMLFSDIQGFTTLSEGLAPERLSRFLNHYLTALVDIILEEDGTIDKFEGDAIIAFWNAPTDVPDHAVRAVRAALRCQQTLAALRPIYAQPVDERQTDESQGVRVGREIHTRIGLNSGEVSVGNFGSSTRFDYTALGDGMNLASRLEGQNKTFGTFVLVSEMTHGKLGGAIPAREVGRVRVVGRERPVTVFEPMFEEDRRARESRLQTYARGLEAWYARRVEEARGLFVSIASEDPPADKMVAQCDYWLSVDRAKWPSAWDGVLTATEK